MMEKFIVLAALFPGLALLASPRGAYPAQPNADELVRAKYVNSADMPTGKAFSHLIGVLNDLDHKTASAMLQDGMQLDSRTASQILAKLLKARDELQTDIAAARRDLGCIAGVPRVHGQEVYPVLERMDDRDELIEAEHLVRFLGELTPELSQKLTQWIDKEKLNISYVKLDYEKMHQRAGFTGDETLSSICNALGAEE